MDATQLQTQVAQLQEAVEAIGSSLSQVRSGQLVVGKQTRVTIGSACAVGALVLAGVVAYLGGQQTLRTELLVSQQKVQESILLLQNDVLGLRRSLEQTDRSIIHHADLREWSLALRASNPNLQVPDVPR
jgi:hypothetical protein